MKPYYEQDGIAIYHGDCRTILPHVEAGLLLTDPPYGIGADKSQMSRSGRRDGNAAVASTYYGASDWDGSAPDPELMALAIARSQFSIIWGANHIGNLPSSSCWLVWDKDNGNNGYADCELAWTNLDKAVRRIRYRWMGMLQEHGGQQKEVRYHPTQKPVPVMQWAIQHAPDGLSVLDPFMGSGSTLRAAKDLGRTAIGIEIEERYCEIAAKRLAQGSLFSTNSEGEV